MRNRQICSVIIPTYKRKRSLEVLLKLLASQSIVEFIEVVIVDQNVDDQKFMIEDVPDGVDAFIYYLGKPNVSQARNLGGLKAATDVLIFMDDDLRPTPKFCESFLLGFLDANISCAVPEVKHIREELIVRPSSEGALENSVISEIDYFISAVFCIKTADYILSGGFDPNLFELVGSTEDTEYYLRLSKRGIRIHRIQGVEIVHVEENEGGCGLRELDYWENRRKFIRGWSFIKRAHRANGILKLDDYFWLLKATFLNRELFSRGISETIKLSLLLVDALQWSRSQQLLESGYYARGVNVNHLDFYSIDES